MKFALSALLVLACACHQDMYDQAKLEPYEASRFFADGRGARPALLGTVARGQMKLDDPHLHSGRVDGKLVETLPMRATRALLERGRERYDIFCAPCHDGLGRGAGVIVRRGFKRPPSFHEERLRAMPIGHFFEVMTQGFGTMYDYAQRVPFADRWAIAAYIRVLQLSQAATVADVPADERSRLEVAEP